MFWFEGSSMQRSVTKVGVGMLAAPDIYPLIEVRWVTLEHSEKPVWVASRCTQGKLLE